MAKKSPVDKKESAAAERRRRLSEIRKGLRESGKKMPAKGRGR